MPLTKSPVSKLAPGRMYRKTVPLAPQTSSSDSPLQIRKYVMILFFHSILPGVEQPQNVRYRKSQFFLRGGYRRISLLCRLTC